jgi:hypothetical protein
MATFANTFRIKSYNLETKETTIVDADTGGKTKPILNPYVSVRKDG